MMTALRLSELHKTLRGELVGDAVAQGVSTDSRHIEKGQLFVALSGENFNGNHFVDSVSQQGAAAAVVSEKQSSQIPQLVVENTQVALGEIAGLQRAQFTGPVIALTGSAGKTSTKEMLANIMSECGTVLATKGNFNNEIGVPLTLLELNQEHQCAIIEMGAAKPHDISYLCQFTKPTIALVTNALQAHLASFGSREVIAKTKGEIYESLTANDVAIVNQDSEYASQWLAQASQARVLTFSLFDHSADIYAKNISEFTTYTQFTLCVGVDSVDVRLALLGRHNIANALAAAAAAKAAGVSLDNIQKGLEKSLAVSGRLNLLRINEHLTVIDDSYNANPDAVKVAIDVLAQSDEQTCLVLGVMAELGAQEKALHYEMGVYAKKKNISHVIAIGQWGEDVVQGYGKGALAFADVTAFENAGLPYCQKGAVLVKGSRSSHMERVVNTIKTTFSNGEK